MGTRVSTRVRVRVRVGAGARARARAGVRARARAKASGDHVSNRVVLRRELLHLGWGEVERRHALGVAPQYRVAHLVRIRVRVRGRVRVGVGVGVGVGFRVRVSVSVRVRFRVRVRVRVSVAHPVGERLAQPSLAELEVVLDHLHEVRVVGVG